MVINYEFDLENGNTEKRLKLIDTLEEFRKEQINLYKQIADGIYVCEYEQATYEKLLNEYLIKLLVVDADKRHGNK